MTKNCPHKPEMLKSRRGVASQLLPRNSQNTLSTREVCSGAAPGGTANLLPQIALAFPGSVGATRIGSVHTNRVCILRRRYPSTNIRCTARQRGFAYGQFRLSLAKNIELGRS